MAAIHAGGIRLLNSSRFENDIHRQVALGNVPHREILTPMDRKVM
jgi:hypothetical protein